MPHSNQPVPAARSSIHCSVAIALALLLAGCERKADDAEPAPAVTGSPSRASAPSNEAEPYEKLTDRRQALVGDAADALDETYGALGLLAKRDYDGATKALARATGKLEVVVRAEPDLAFAPVAVEIRTYDLLATPKDVDTLRKAAKEALDDGRLQEGRKLIRDLASEHV